MSYRSGYGSGYSPSSSSLRRSYTPSYSSLSSALLYKPSTYSSFSSTYRRPSFGSSSNTTSSSENLPTGGKYGSSTVSRSLPDSCKTSSSRRPSDLSGGSFDAEEYRRDNLRDDYSTTTPPRTDVQDYKKMYEKEHALRLTEQATLIEELQTQIELRDQIIAVFEKLAPLDEELEQEEERCNLLEQLQSLSQENDRLIKQQQQQQQQQNSQKLPQRTALGSRRF